MMDWIENLPPEIRTFVSQIRNHPKFPEQLLSFAAVLHNRHENDTALSRELALRAWKLDPNNPTLRQGVEWAIRKSVPKWHFSIVNDLGRNEVYERALQHFVTPETVVLEIGAGTGILAMMTARAGAKHVYACEMEPLIAQAAQENIIRNGYADRITVIPKKSTDLAVGEDFPAPADLLVSEIISNDLLGEDVLSIMEDAHKRLLRPSALVLPSRVALRGALVGGAPWSDHCRLGEISGFDLSAFNRLSPPVINIKEAEYTLDQALSDDVELFHFDFSAPAQYPAERKVITLTARRAGLADGFLHWVWLGFSDDIQYDVRPPSKSTTWNPMLHVFPEPLSLQAGDTVNLVVEHNRKTVMVRLKS
jgi:type II protein arginine methyltransferase